MNVWSSPSLRRERRRPIRSALVLCVFVVAAAQAGPVALSLDDARRSAAREAPSVAAQRARVDAAREDAARAGALPDPTMTLGIDNLTITGTEAFRLGADEMTMRRVAVMQEWPSRRKREAREASAQAHLDTAASETEAVRLEVERRAGEAWIAAWTAEAEARALDDLVAESERALEIAKAHLTNGTGSAADALAAQLVRAEADNDVRRLDVQRRTAHAGLARWLHESVDAPLAPMPDVTTLRDPPERLRQTLDQHAHLQVWAGRERAAETAVALALAEKRPDLGFGVSYGARSAGLPDMMMFEVSVGLPLFTRNRQDRSVAARRADLDAVLAQREDARREQREALERQVASWEGLRDELGRYETTLLPLARDRSAVALAAYANGSELQPWIEARRDEIQMRRRAVQLQADLARAWLTLDTLLPRTAAAEEQP